jgi:hypothetical protein
LRDDLSPEDFAPIEQALKRLPYFDPSPGFADRVMARVTRFQPVAAPGVINPPSRQHVVRMPELTPQRDEIVHYMRRPLPVRLAATALLASAAVTMSVIALIAVFRLDLFLFVAQTFGEQALGFMALLGDQAAASVLGDTALGYVQTAGSAAGIATIGTFVLGAVAATAVLRAAASTTRKAA